jgi:hypothetical protein
MGKIKKKLCYSLLACRVRANAASSGRSELTPYSSRPTLTSRCLPCYWRQTLPAPMMIPPLWADPSRPCLSWEVVTT